MQRESTPDHLDEDVMPRGTARRKLPVDLETIVEIASDHGPCLDSCYERTGFVDLQTGEVHIVYRDALRCANGELEVEELDEWSVECLEVANQVLSDTERRFVEIEQWHSSDGYDLMAEFVEGVRDPHVRNRLEFALRGSKPFRRFKDALFEWPELRAAWFAFQGHEQRDQARRWLLNYDIEAVDSSSYQLPPRPQRW